MTISYKWLCQYLPVAIEPERLSRILTSIGLEVESMENYGEIKGGLQGLLIGQVLSTEKHPNADKLKTTTVDIGEATPLQIVCGAANVAEGQKVVVATVGTVLYPTAGEAFTIKAAKIRGVESAGMICAEDEIGLGSSHEGIMVLPTEVPVGTAAADYFKPYSDIVYEIGLTPNRMDAMSHWGVARDVCAYLSHHDKKAMKAQLPNNNGFKIDEQSMQMEVTVENPTACKRYSGLSLAGLTVKESPVWLKEKLKAIGLRPINNIVDITNYIQHETGQPLHAFDADKIAGKKIIVKNLPEGSLFTTLDEKERKLSADDLMICDAEGGACIAGVFGGLHSGVTDETKNIFLESACFDSITIRKTAFRHLLRTDAAIRFEKGTDISATVPVLKRAAQLIKEVCGGVVASSVIDIYPTPQPKNEVAITWQYIKKLSGKNYHPDSVKDILNALGFEILKEGVDELRIAVPFHKIDISLAADIVEEIVRIDGLDNILIPENITLAPAIEENYTGAVYQEKLSNQLAGNGFYEIMTNSITNIAYYSEAQKATMVKMINSLSAELNCMRPSLLETMLESVAHNINHRNTSLKFFEFGKSYQLSEAGHYTESKELSLIITGGLAPASWQQKELPADFYFLKGIVQSLLQSLGIEADSRGAYTHEKLTNSICWKSNNKTLAFVGEITNATLATAGIKQSCFFATLNWELIATLPIGVPKKIKTISKFPVVQRDLAMVLPAQLAYAEVEQAIQKIKLSKLQSIKLFDIFESEKLGIDKKSLALSFTFADEEKTLTDKEIETWMNKIMGTLEADLQAEIRK